MRHICMRQTLLLIIVFLFSVGCCAPHRFPHVLHVDARFTPAEQECIVSAVNEWEKATDGIVEITPVITNGMVTPKHINVYRPDGRHAIFVANFLDDRVLGRADLATRLGLISANNIWINRQSIWKYHPHRYLMFFRMIVMHELGHHLGLNHFKNYRYQALMQPYDSEQTPCITPADLQQFCSLYNCKGRNVKTTCDPEDMVLVEHIKKYEN